MQPSHNQNMLVNTDKQKYKIRVSPIRVYKKDPRREA
jgi:hypothetical protein